MIRDSDEVDRSEEPVPLVRRLPFFRTLLSLSAALVLAAALVLSLWRLDRISVAPGRVTGGSVQVTAPRGGLIAQVLVLSGQTVAAGQPLVMLDKRDLAVEAERRQASIDALETRRRAGIQERKHLEEAVQPREREEAASQRERARLRLAQAEISAQAMARLGQEGIAGHLQVEQADLERKLASVAVTDADQALALLKDRQKQQLDALAAEVERLDEEIKAERLQREATVAAIESSLLKAAAAGVVATERLEDLPGRAVAAGDELLRIATGGPRRFEGMLSDLARAQVRPDQRVKIRLDAYPWLLYGTLKGQVVRIAERREGEAGFPVEVALDTATAPGPLTDGMRGTARIVVEEKVSLLRMFLENATGRTGA